MLRINRTLAPAARFGSRLLPLTTAVPEGMPPVLGTPAIRYIALEAAATGIAANPAHRLDTSRSVAARR